MTQVARIKRQAPVGTICQSKRTCDLRYVLHQVKTVLPFLVAAFDFEQATIRQTARNFLYQRRAGDTRRHLPFLHPFSGLKFCFGGFACILETQVTK